MNIVLTYLGLIIMLLIETIVFMWQDSLMGGDDTAPLSQELWLSLPCILKIAAYVMAFPLAMRLIYIWIKGNWHNGLMRIYLNIAGSIMFILWLFNLEVFGYKEYKMSLGILVQTFSQSIANISFIKGAVMLVLVGLLAYCLYWMIKKLYKLKKHDPIIFIPIRPSAAVRFAHSIVIILVGATATYMLKGSMPSMPSFNFSLPTSKTAELEQDTIAADTEQALKELYAMPHTLGLDDTEAYEHPRPQMITDKRPNILIILLPGFNASYSKVLNADADASAMPFVNKMYENGIGFTQFYANSTDLKAGVPNLSYVTKTLKDNGYSVEELYNSYEGAEDKTLLNNLYSSIEKDRNNGIGREGKPFLKIVRTNLTHAVAAADACLKNFIGKLWYTPTWRNTLIIAMGEAETPKDAKELDNPEYYHVPMFWTGGVVSAHGHVDIMCQQADLASTLLGQMGINYDKLTFSNNIFDRTVPHFAFFSHGESFGFLTDSIRYVQNNAGTPLPTTNDPDGKAKRWGQALLSSKNK